MSLTVKRYLCLRHLWIVLAMPLAASSSLIYITNNAGTSMQVVDPATNKVVQVIEGIEAPEAARFSPDGSRVYVTNKGESVLNVVDRKTGKTIKKVPLSGFPNDQAVTRDGRRVLVCIAQPPGALDIIDTTSLERIKSIPTKARLHDIDVSADGKYAVAGAPEGKTATVFDLQTEQIAWEIPFDQGVMPIAIENGPNGSARRIFLQLEHLNGFAVVDFAKHEEVARIKLPAEPSGFAGRGSPSHGIGVAPDGKTLWVNSTEANSVFAYSLPEIKLLGRVPLPELKIPGKDHVGASPNWVTFTPDSKTVYVSNSALMSVSAIDVKTLKEVARIPVGEMPKRISTLVLP